MEASPYLIPITITVVGFFVTTVGAINAFFLRGIFLDLNAVKISMASIFAEANGREQRITRLETETKELYKEGAVRDEKIHKLDGSQKQMFEYIKEKDNL